MWKERTRKTERKEIMEEGTERENGRKGGSEKGRKKDYQFTVAFT